MLDVGGQNGTVTSIGLRASVLQLWDGTETLIPNSSLLENNVTNWTYSSRKVRFSVTVGVAYGSDTRRVIHALNEVAERHGLVEKEPETAGAVHRLRRQRARLRVALLGGCCQSERRASLE